MLGRLVKRFRKLSRKNKLLFLIPPTVALLAGIGVYLYLTFSNVWVKGKPLENLATDASSPINLPEDDPSINVLFLGTGGPGHEGSNLSDSNILVHVDTQSKKAAIITIPRDLWVPIPTNGDKTTFNKINMAYAIGLDDSYSQKKDEFKGEAGGGNLSKYVASFVTGMRVDKFVEVDFVGFQRVIGLLGGIKVNVPKTYDDYYYPVIGKELDLCGFSPDKVYEINQDYTGFDLEKQFTCRYEHIHFDQGQMQMSGELALKYVRSRHGDNDFGRSERQAAVLKGIEDKIVSLNVVKNGGKLLDQLNANVRTDIGKDEIKALAALIGNPDDYQITDIHLTEDNVLVQSKSSGGAFILIPKAGNNNWAGIHDFIKQSL